MIPYKDLELSLENEYLHYKSKTIQTILKECEETAKQEVSVKGNYGFHYNKFIDLEKMPKTEGFVKLLRKHICDELEYYGYTSYNTYISVDLVESKDYENHISVTVLAKFKRPQYSMMRIFKEYMLNILKLSFTLKFLKQGAENK